MNPATPIASLTDLVKALSGQGPRTLELQTSVACPFFHHLAARLRADGTRIVAC